jgi:predicted transglutaminase-like cysteine proteinase
MRLFPLSRNSCATALALGMCLLGSPDAHAGLFGKEETPFTDLRPFPKWTDMLQRYEKERNGTGPACSTRDYDFCHYPEWRDFTESVRPLPKDHQLDEVNRFFNKNPYILDLSNWGVTDYWETPGQFLARSGDCEDFAIIKYMTLRNLGWPVASLRIVILEDMNLKIGHAVLAVDYLGRSLILDNQISVVTDANRIHHYRPIYAVNEEGWWRFH